MFTLVMSKFKENDEELSARTYSIVIIQVNKNVFTDRPLCKKCFFIYLISNRPAQ